MALLHDELWQTSEKLLKYLKIFKEFKLNYHIIFCKHLENSTEVVFWHRSQDLGSINHVCCVEKYNLDTVPVISICVSWNNTRLEQHKSVKNDNKMFIWELNPEDTARVEPEGLQAGSAI